MVHPVTAEEPAEDPPAPAVRVEVARGTIPPDDWNDVAEFPGITLDRGAMVQCWIGGSWHREGSEWPVGWNMLPYRIADHEGREESWDCIAADHRDGDRLAVVIWGGPVAVGREYKIVVMAAP